MVERLANTEINARRITHIEACFGSSGHSLYHPSRVLVGEGVLTKLCRKKPKARQFFLFNDVLVYGNIVINKKRYNKQNIIHLKHVRVEEIPQTNSYELSGDTDLQNGWLIISPAKSFAVYAQTAMEKQEWMTHMRRCIDDERNKAGLQGNEGVNAPAWVPDVEALECMRCSKVKFSTLQRRHHCRRCGYVVCTSCSAKKTLLPQQSAKPLRVCDSCYDAVKNNVPAPSTGSNQSESHQYGAIADSSDSESDEEQNDEQVHL